MIDAASTYRPYRLKKISRILNKYITRKENKSRFFVNRTKLHRGMIYARAIRDKFSLTI